MKRVKPLTTSPRDPVYCLEVKWSEKRGYYVSYEKLGYRYEIRRPFDTEVDDYHQALFGGGMRRMIQGQKKFHIARAHFNRQEFAGQKMGLIHSDEKPWRPQLPLDFDKFMEIIERLQALGDDRANYVRITTRRLAGTSGVSIPKYSGVRFSIQLLPLYEDEYLVGSDFLFNPSGFRRLVDPRSTVPVKGGITYVVGGMAKDYASELGLADVVLFREENGIDLLSDYASANIWGIDGNNTLVLPDIKGVCLFGTMYQQLIGCAGSLGVNVETRKLTVEDTLNLVAMGHTGTAARVGTVTNLVDEKRNVVKRFGKCEVAEELVRKLLSDIADGVEYPVLRMF